MKYILFGNGFGIDSPVLFVPAITQQTGVLICNNLELISPNSKIKTHPLIWPVYHETVQTTNFSQKVCSEQSVCATL